MFQLDQIKEAQSKVKSGADFPAFVKALIALGVQKYDCHINDGQALYFGEADYRIKSQPAYPLQRVANISDKERFKHHLKNHQRGQTDYETFCRYAAETGVQKWTVNMQSMTCTYYDKSNTEMLIEKVTTF